MLARNSARGIFSSDRRNLRSFIIAEAAYLYNEKIRNQAFQNAIDSMSKSTIVATESIKDTTVTGINALVNIDTLRDVNDLAKSKSQNQPAQK